MLLYFVEEPRDEGGVEVAADEVGEFGGDLVYE